MFFLVSFFPGLPAYVDKVGVLVQFFPTYIWGSVNFSSFSHSALSISDTCTERCYLEGSG
jgi:hypothetical protein